VRVESGVRIAEMLSDIMECSSKLQKRVDSLIIHTRTHVTVFFLPREQRH